MERKKLYHDTPLSSSCVLSTEWKGFDVVEKLAIERDAQILSIKFVDPFKIDFENDGGIINNDGDPIEIEAELIDSAGNRFELPFSGARGNLIAKYRSEDDLPHVAFKTLRLKANSAIYAAEIMWTTYNFRDMK